MKNFFTMDKFFYLIENIMVKGCFIKKRINIILNHGSQMIEYKVEEEW
jgi:hypothetical protein